MAQGKCEAAPKSEVAAFLERWDLEAEAARRGLEGFGEVARHEILNKRAEDFDRYLPQLQVLMAAQQAQQNAHTTESP